MSDHKQRLRERKLPLPSPRSPRDLDDRILNHAREHAPPTRLFVQPRWLAGLATASVLLIAVFITEPEQSTPEFRAITPTDEDVATPSLSSKTTMADKPAARMKMSSDIASPTRNIQKYELRKGQKQLIQEISADAQTEAAAEADMARDDKTAGIALGSANSVTYSDTEIRNQLRRCADLLQQGQATQARAAYQQLRSECPACDLPATLEQAIETLSADPSNQTNE
jgi:hypothetical protein